MRPTRGLLILLALALFANLLVLVRVVKQRGADRRQLRVRGVLLVLAALQLLLLELLPPSLGHLEVGMGRGLQRETEGAVTRSVSSGAPAAFDALLDKTP